MKKQNQISSNKKSFEFLKMKIELWYNVNTGEHTTPHITTFGGIKEYLHRNFKLNIFK